MCSELAACSGAMVRRRDRGEHARGNPEGDAKAMVKFDESSGLGRCHFAGGKAREAIYALAAQTGRIDEVRVWSRNDLLCSTFKSSCKGGPAWNQVIGRVTVADGSNDVLERRLVEQIGRSGEHAKLPDGMCSTTTFLLYFQQRPLLRREDATTPRSQLVK